MSSMAFSLASAKAASRCLSSIITTALAIRASNSGLEKRPRFAPPMPALGSLVASNARKGEEVSPEAAPQPARMKENSILLAREKKMLEGIVSTLVGIPLRERNCATA